jgi:hypothetical protein
MARPKLFIFCLHKVGTVLFSKIMNGVGKKLGLRVKVLYGMVDQIDPRDDVVIFAHSLINVDLSKIPHRGIRILRDPRDIWISGYLYHKRCDEPWCVNENFDLTAPIQFPRVPYSQQHRSEDWKRAYLEGLNGKSYQRNLLGLDDARGMEFEEDRYLAWTAEAMMNWKGTADTREVKLEEIAERFDEEMLRIFQHFGFDARETSIAVKIAAEHDTNRMSDEKIAKNNHIHSRSISKWRNTLTEEQLSRFDRRYGELIRTLGYAESGIEQPAIAV